MDAVSSSPLFFKDMNALLFLTAKDQMAAKSNATMSFELNTSCLLARRFNQ